MKKKSNHITFNPWGKAKIHTPARIALGHVGGSLPTSELLKFQADHATARDAIHSAANFKGIEETIRTVFKKDSLYVESAASSRDEYLRRPDLGRKLHSEYTERVAEYKNTLGGVLIIIGDGLSATAINHHAIPLLKEIYSYSEISQYQYPIILAKEARVALGDEIGEIAGSTLVVMLIGERPGLSNAESIGAYITYAPKIGRTDAERNCISNICPKGLPLHIAAKQIASITSLALQQKLTGVSLSNTDSLQNKKTHDSS